MTNVLTKLINVFKYNKPTANECNGKCGCVDMTTGEMSELKYDKNGVCISEKRTPQFDLSQEQLKQIKYPDKFYRIGNFQYTLSRKVGWIWTNPQNMQELEYSGTGFVYIKRDGKTKNIVEVFAITNDSVFGEVRNKIDLICYKNSGQCLIITGVNALVGLKAELSKESETEVEFN